MPWIRLHPIPRRLICAAGSAQLVNELKRLGLFDSSLLVVTSSLTDGTSALADHDRESIRRPRSLGHVK